MASVCFADGADIDYFLTDVGFSKSTNLAPCPVWLCKTGFEDSKALFEANVEESVKKFSDAFASQT